jgi:hypothetical protein
MILMRVSFLMRGDATRDRMGLDEPPLCGHSGSLPAIL